MKVKVGLLVALILTNLIWGYQAYQFKQDELVSATTIYRLSGTSDSWAVEDYLIIVTPNYISRGHGRLLYTNALEDLEGATDFSVKALEKDSKGSKGTVFHFASNLIDSGLSQNGLKEDFGSIGQANDQYEKLTDKSHYDSTEIEIRWKDSMGTLHQDLVKLSIVKTISLGK